MTGQSSPKPDYRRKMLGDELREIERASALDPQSNPIKLFGFEILRALEDGKTDLDTLASIIGELGEETLCERAAAFHALHDLDGVPARRLVVEQTLTALASEGFAAFNAALGRAAFGVVFTGHPTFSLSQQAYLKLRDKACGDDKKSEQIALAPRSDITLHEEHELAQQAVAHANEALSTLRRLAIEIARKHHPEQWRDGQYLIANVASWVGYDLDGRTDIHWGASIGIRLREKATALKRYACGLEGIADCASIVVKLRAVADRAERDSEGFFKDLTDPDKTVAAANALTRQGEDKLISLSGVIGELTAIIKKTDDETAARLLSVIWDMKANSLGASLIHLRVNAAQVRSALGEAFGVDANVEAFGRSTLERAAAEAREIKPQAISFASLFLEQMTARRQMMLCAQILKHIDADAPIRFLIAECEHPATIMGAIYLARLYGVADKLDISPLFETPDAIEGGGRFIEQLLRQDEYLSYARRRGAVSIQIGYSDSGRFMGQIAAHLAAERLQILIARALSKQGVHDLDVIIFNTHGESMGRGAHPSSFEDRLNHLLTPWARARFAAENVPSRPECSFQGGDGFLHFANPALAESTVLHLARHYFMPPSADKSDPFYSDINFSWDIYRRLKSWQEALFADSDYGRLLQTTGSHILYKTGSRKSVRQSKEAAIAAGASALRAIPNNAILQQFSAPANLWGGLGDAAAIDPDRFSALVKESAHLQQVMRLANHARARTDLDVMRAFASSIDAAYWLARAVRAENTEPAPLYLSLSKTLDMRGANAPLRRLATKLGADLALYDTIVARQERSSAPRPATLSILQSIRIALFMRALALAAQTPKFSRRHDIEHEDVIDAVMGLDIAGAADMIAQVFPAMRHDISALSGLDEQAQLPEASGYREINEQIVYPLRKIAGMMRELTAAISNCYGAFG